MIQAVIYYGKIQKSENIIINILIKEFYLIDWRGANGNTNAKY